LRICPNPVSERYGDLSTIEVRWPANGYQCKWLTRAETVHYELVNLHLRAAPTSLVVSLANLPLTTAAFVLGFWTPYGEWAVLLFMVFVPLLIATTVVFFLRDVWRPVSRRRAILGLLLSIPPLLAEGWFYRGLRWP
jgi:sterol desaturase/sphingolipid hydroxylase (fatty acid hydroxylase superfamily)